MLHRMRSLIEVSPDVAKKEILKAFKQAKCHYQETGDLLGCNQHTVTRWARMLGIKEELDAMEERAKEEGWFHGRHGGAGYHKNPELRAKRAKRTRAANKKKAA